MLNKLFGRPHLALLFQLKHPREYVPGREAVGCWGSLVWSRHIETVGKKGRCGRQEKVSRNNLFGLRVQKNDGGQNDPMD